LQMFDLDEDNKLIMTPIDKYSNQIERVTSEKAEELRSMYHFKEQS